MYSDYLNAEKVAGVKVSYRLYGVCVCMYVLVVHILTIHT